MRRGRRHRSHPCPPPSRREGVRRKIAVLLCALVGAVLIAMPAARAANASVNIQNFSFQPQSVTINVGETVTWTMEDPGTQHTVTADGSSFSSAPLSTGQ